MAADKHDVERDAHLDPLTQEPGAHPVGTGLGAAAGGMAAGAAMGALTGPVGMALGAVVGAVAGGLAGKGVAEAIDPTREDDHWRANYRTREYVDPTDDYDDFGPAYRFGADRYAEHRDRTFDDVEPELSHDWGAARGPSRLEWERARPASRDAWERLQEFDGRER